ncbi:MAG TPA: metal-dependent hydrolase [Bryobacteraceae bacterium]
MDNITHTLTGLALSRAGLNRWYSHSAWVLVLAANAPDVDIAWAFRGSLPYFENHRGITHAIVMAPVMALIVVLLVCAITRSMRGWKAAYGLAIIGVASHLLFDWTNSYGVRFLLPFSSEWFRLDVNNIIDLWIWGVLLIATVGPLLGRLVSSEIGAKPGSGRGLAIFALSFLLLYDFGRHLVHQRALDILNSRVYQGGAPLRAAAFPTSVANPFKWTGWIDRPAFAMRFSMDLLGDFDPGAGTIFFKPESGLAMDAARQTHPVQVFLNFAQFPLWRIIPVADPEGAHRVEVRDWRFSFAAGAIVDASDRVVSSYFHF